LNSQQAADFVEDGAQRHNRGICCLQSRTGKYLSTNADGDASCRQSDPSDWETFQVATQREDPAPGLMDATVGDLAASIKAPALIWTLRSAKANKLDPLYLTLNADGEVDFDALGSVTDDEEKFVAHELRCGWFTLESHAVPGLFLTAQDGGEVSGVLVGPGEGCELARCGAEQEFKMGFATLRCGDAPDTRVSLSSCFSKFLAAGENGEARFSRTRTPLWETSQKPGQGHDRVDGPPPLSGAGRVPSARATVKGRMAEGVSSGLSALEDGLSSVGRMTGLGASLKASAAGDKSKDSMLYLSSGKFLVAKKIERPKAEGPATYALAWHTQEQHEQHGFGYVTVQKLQKGRGRVLLKAGKQVLQVHKDGTITGNKAAGKSRNSQFTLTYEPRVSLKSRTLGYLSADQVTKEIGRRNKRGAQETFEIVKHNDTAEVSLRTAEGLYLSFDDGAMNRRFREVCDNTERCIPVMHSNGEFSFKINDRGGSRFLALIPNTKGGAIIGFAEDTATKGLMTKMGLSTIKGSPTVVKDMKLTRFRLRTEDPDAATNDNDDGEDSETDEDEVLLEDDLEEEDGSQEPGVIDLNRKKHMWLDVVLIQRLLYRLCILTFFTVALPVLIFYISATNSRLMYLDDTKPIKISLKSCDLRMEHANPGVSLHMLVDLFHQNAVLSAINRYPEVKVFNNNEYYRPGQKQTQKYAAANSTEIEVTNTAQSGALWCLNNPEDCYPCTVILRVPKDSKLPSFYVSGLGSVSQSFM
jgi:hypothetical protein